MPGMRTEALRRCHGGLRWLPAAALALLLSGCSTMLAFPQNVPALNDGFGAPQLDHQQRTVERDAYLAMPGFGEIVLTLPAGTTMGRQPHGRPSVSLMYARNRGKGVTGARWRNLEARGLEPDAHGALRLPVPHVAGYHPISLLVWVRTPESAGAQDMRIDFPLTETAVVDADDADRHDAFWRGQHGQCIDRGRIQPIEYADDKGATIDGERYPFRFDTRFEGLCVFRQEHARAIVTTGTPGRVLRSPVRVRIPRVYQDPRFSAYWQPPTPAAAGGAE